MPTAQSIEFREPAARAGEAAHALQATDSTDELQDMQGEKMVLNMGPSHPSTHGVLRILLEMDGEIITKAMPDIGYLHRGDEKIAENMTYTQFIPYTDRLDYLAPLANNVAYALAVEKLMGIDQQLPPRCQYIRVMCCELARISAHLLGLGAFFNAAHVARRFGSVPFVAIADSGPPTSTQAMPTCSLQPARARGCSKPFPVTSSSSPCSSRAKPSSFPCPVWTAAWASWTTTLR